MSTGKCKDVWKDLKNISDVMIELPDCETLPSKEGGEYLECFIPCNNGRGRFDDNVTGKYHKLIYDMV